MEEEEEGELTSSIGGALQLVAPKAKGGLGVGRESVVLFGQSIGCAVAIEMATKGWGVGRVSPLTRLPFCPPPPCHNLVLQWINRGVSAGQWPGWCCSPRSSRSPRWSMRPTRSRPRCSRCAAAANTASLLTTHPLPDHCNARQRGRASNWEPTYVYFLFGERCL